MVKKGLGFAAREELNRGGRGIPGGILSMEFLMNKRLVIENAAP